MQAKHHVLEATAIVAVGAAAVALAIVAVRVLVPHHRQPAALVEQRWLPEAPPAPKADRLTQVAAAGVLIPPEHSSPPPASPGGPVEQMLERKADDIAGEQASRAYRLRAYKQALGDDRPRDVCARHGLRKVVVHHGRGWRCR
jgi:hypothetical protein